MDYLSWPAFHPPWPLLSFNSGRLIVPFVFVRLSIYDLSWRCLPFICSTGIDTAPETSQIRVFPYSLDLLSHLRLYYLTAARTHCNSTTSTMTETDSNLPKYSSRMSPEELEDACDDICTSLRTKQNLLSAPPNSSFQTSEEQQRQMLPYTKPGYIAAGLHGTMATIEADKRRKCFKDQERYHNRLLGIQALREPWMDKDTPHDLVDEVASLNAVTSLVQSAFFQSLQRGENPEKKEYCDTVAKRFWEIGQGSKFGCCHI